MYVKNANLITEKLRLLWLKNKKRKRARRDCSLVLSKIIVNMS